MNIFGKLTFAAFEHGWIVNTAVGFMCLAVVGVCGLLFYYKRWGWLWKEWLTSLDPKKIGVMYLAVGLIMLLRGAIDAGMMRAQLVFSVGASHGYLTSDHYYQVLTSHGVIMIFFVAMAMIFGLLNLVVPLQIGSRDVAFPFLNSISFWLFVAGAALVSVSLAIGEFAATGWLAYPPLSELQYSPGVGVDYFIWSLQIAGAGSLLSGINFLVTIIKMRAPGMSLMRMPLFTWTAFASVILVIFAFPILTVTLLMLFLDRFFGMHFFTTDLGGNLMMYVNLIWTWGHPEVYILILPMFGVFSEVVPTFSQKRLFGYVSMVAATIAIMLLSFMVWLHHFFTMGSGADVNAFFGIATMVIAIPTGVKVFNWLFTMFRGRIIFATPMMWFLGFVATFTLGGAAGVLLAIPPADFQLHNSLFLVAHFHTMIIGGVLFGFFAGFTYWFPKIMGFKLNEQLGTYAFWCWLLGFLMAFVPLYLLGLMGMTRRLDHYDISTGWQPLLIVSAIGVAVIACGIAFQVLQLIVSIKQRAQNTDTTGDPWNARTLEWLTSSPPPPYNFALTPIVHGRDAFWAMKHADVPHIAKPHYHDIYMPKNTAVGIYIAAFSFCSGFGLIWHIMWLVALGAGGVIACVIARAFDDHTEYVIPAAQVERIEMAFAHKRSHS